MAASIRVIASSETGSGSTAVRGYYRIVEVSIPFDPVTVLWKTLRKTIEREIASAYNDGYRRWVWGLYGMNGRHSEFILYDAWFESKRKKMPEDRVKFARAVSAAGANRDKFYIKAKWSWPQNGCAHVLGSENGIEAFAGDVEIGRDAAAQVIQESVVDGNAQLSNALLRSRADRQQQSIHLLEYNRISERFEISLLAALEDCRSKLEANNFDVRLPSGLKIFVPPDMYEQVIHALEDYPQLRSRHVVASDEFVPLVRAAISEVPKILPKSERVLVDGVDEDFFPVVMIKSTFIHIPGTVPSMFTKPSTKPCSAPGQLQGRLEW